jgi:hypothetical protein
MVLRGWGRRRKIQTPDPRSYNVSIVKIGIHFEKIGTCTYLHVSLYKM